MKYLLYILMLMLNACGSHARLIIIDGQISTTGWQEEFIKHKFNIEDGVGTPKIITGNQSDIRKTHENPLYEDKEYESKDEPEKEL